MDPVRRGSRADLIFHCLFFSSARTRPSPVLITIDHFVPHEFLQKIPMATYTLMYLFPRKFRYLVDNMCERPAQCPSSFNPRSASIPIPPLPLETRHPFQISLQQGGSSPRRGWIESPLLTPRVFSYSWAISSPIGVSSPNRPSRVAISL